MSLKTKGLVLREVQYKEADKILTICTQELGKLTVTARGARRPKSKYLAASQLFSYGELELEERYGRWYLKEARLIEGFSKLQRDVLLLATGAYFVEVLEAISNEGLKDLELLAFGLNSLHILSEEKMPPGLIKAVFEVRAMCLAGYTPEIYHCFQCGGASPQEPALLLRLGQIACRACRGTHQSLTLDGGSLQAMRHIVGANMGKLFSFALGPAGQQSLEKAAEAYVLAQLDRTFKTLDFLKKLG